MKPLPLIGSMPLLMNAATLSVAVQSVNVKRSSGLPLFITGPVPSTIGAERRAALPLLQVSMKANGGRHNHLLSRLIPPWLSRQPPAPHLSQPVPPTRLSGHGGFNCGDGGEPPVPPTSLSADTDGVGAEQEAELALAGRSATIEAEAPPEPPQEGHSGNRLASLMSAVYPLLAAGAMSTCLQARAASPAGFMRMPPSQLSPSVLLYWLNVVVFVINAMWGNALNEAGAKLDTKLLVGEWHRLFTPIFLHADLFHLMMNDTSLSNVGPFVEAVYGWSRFFLIYLIAGVAGNLLSFTRSVGIKGLANLSPGSASGRSFVTSGVAGGARAAIPSLGASGSVLGLVGALVVYALRFRLVLGQSGDRLLRDLCQSVGLIFVYGLLPGSRIDNFGHLGGFVGGLAVSYLTGPRVDYRYVGDGYWRLYRARPIIDLPRRQDLDALLKTNAGRAESRFKRWTADWRARYGQGRRGRTPARK
ncbi:unnamed protein product [Vitrella brassicaformis CCMP3155]|uniref:Peptidase S54 rhomboid domain-containing protein n=2 Tax=Vitrella brassicaformis TaxID=1169539 RepID=A0A0G4F2E7_VITBC|nr:unnamed protein product [Vitrella brassicaformis CCMP3155]|mmetsp:Transcript_35536/g.102117  ORF Transcript_35536/g.102117 Transcript_35536/m.102117 type:complete len:474 (-) Transcript_35536:1635-3056(-)|eukprot:CEM05545.1 unnamed protein product [Vitrella brassicaformis CCMP3155]